MSSNTTFTQVNKFFIDFLNKMNVDSDIIEIWETEHQDELNQLLNESEIEKTKNKKETKKEKTKKPKDAPKNARSAYIFFSTEKRAEVKEQNQELTSKEITVKLGEMWKEIKDTPEAEKYIQLALNDKDRYKEEMAHYVPSDSDSESVASNKSKKPRAKKPKDAPKSVRSAYMYFCQATRGSVKEEFPTLASKEITVKLGEMWQKIKDTEEAKKFHELSTLDKIRYREEMDNYVSDTESVNSANSANSMNKKLNKKPRNRKPRDAPKSARSAYFLLS